MRWPRSSSSSSGRRPRSITRPRRRAIPRRRRRLLATRKLVSGSRKAIRALHQPVRPLDEVLHVRAVLVPAVVLAPRELTPKKANIDRRHLRSAVAVLLAEVPGAEEAEHGTSRDCRHVTALMIEPVCVALLGDAVADEHPSRCDERDELMRIDGDIVGGFCPEDRFGGSVFQEIAGHPMVLAGAGKVLDRLAKVAAVQLRPAFAG